MKISPAAANSIYGINRQNAVQNTRQLSFCAADEFVSKPRGGFWEARKTLQREYLPKIAELRKQEKQQWFDVCKRALEMQRRDDMYTTNVKSLAICAKTDKKHDPKSTMGKIRDLLLAYTERAHLEFKWSFSDPNCSAVISKDKKMAEDFLMLAEYYSKLASSTHKDSYLDRKFGPYNQAYGIDFVYLPDKTGDNNALQDALLDLLEKSEENYKKTGRPTIITVENMERLIRPESNSRGNISCMKDLMSSANEDFHAHIQCAITDFEKCDPAARASHRINNICNLDEAGIRKEDINFYTYVIKELKPTVDEMTEVYKEGGIENFKLRQEIDKLTTEYKQKIKELDTLYPKETRPPRPKLKADEGIIAGKGKMGAAIALLSVACVAFGALAVHFKRKKEKTLQDTQKSINAFSAVQNDKIKLSMGEFLTGLKNN